ncbi:MAG: hypothetical protein ACOC9J_02230 [Persicimonas sp.]
MNDTSAPTRHEREPYGITYDRLRLDRVFEQLLSRYPIQTVLEYPAEGAKAMPSIYSLALGALGCDITLVNPSPQGVDVWRRLGLEDRIEVVEVDQLSQSELDTGRWDLVWNFVSVGFRSDFEQVLAEMVRLSGRYVLTVHCNAYNLGYPWHHFLHWALGLEWTHGETDYFWPHRVRAAYRDAGAAPCDFGLFDMPGWPDPPGFRDVRLHLNGGDDVDIFEWSAPIADFYARGQLPPLMKWLSRIESAPVPRALRYIFSHLFFVLASVDGK